MSNSRSKRVECAPYIRDIISKGREIFYELTQQRRFLNQRYVAYEVVDALHAAAVVEDLRYCVRLCELRRVAEIVLELQFQIDPDILNKFHGVGMQVAMVQELSDHLRAYLARGRKHPDAESEYNFTGYMLNLESKTIEDHVWAVVTTEGATPEDMIKNSELYDAVRSNGYNQSKTKFTRDTKMILRSNANNVAYVTHGKQFVYRNLKWLDTPMQMSRTDPFDQQF